MAKQLKETYTGKTIVQVVANQHPHKFAWFSDAADTYEVKLIGRRVDEVVCYGGLIEVELGDMRLTFGDGLMLRWQDSVDTIKQKHQLLLIFNDGSVLTGSVQMDGGLWCFKAGTNQNPYDTVAKEKPSPLTEAFDRAYFEQLGSHAGVEKLSLKAFLATEQI